MKQNLLQSRTLYTQTGATRDSEIPAIVTGANPVAETNWPFAHSTTSPATLLNVAQARTPDATLGPGSCNICCLSVPPNKPQMACCLGIRHGPSATLPKYTPFGMEHKNTSHLGFQRAKLLFWREGFKKGFVPVFLDPPESSRKIFPARTNHRGEAEMPSKVDCHHQINTSSLATFHREHRQRQCPT